MTTTRIVEGLAHLPDELRARGASRVLVITGESRRFLERLPLEGFEVTVFDGAEVHVPRATVTAAADALRSSRAEAVVTLGGGSATGLGKALRLESGSELAFVAVPTTYAGSEMTNLYGITDGGDKVTGKDDRVRPDVVIHEPDLFFSMPKKLTVTSLLNALAHPIGALSDGAMEDSLRSEARRAIARLTWALEQLLSWPGSRDGRRDALAGTALAAGVLDGAALGRHHELAHLLGGRFGLDHAGLHAVLLPCSVDRLAREEPSLYAEIADAAGVVDLPATLYDALTRAAAPRSLLDLGVSHEALEALASERPLLREGWARDAWLGRRPSAHTRRWDAGDRPETSVTGPDPKDASRVVIALHGRGANAGRITKDALDLVGHDPTVCIVAPQSPTNAWSEQSYRAPRAEHGEPLESSMVAVRALVASVLEEIEPSKVFLFGFSQGAGLAIELFATSEVRLGGLVALAGARIGPVDEQPPITVDLSGARVLLGVSEGDRWLDAADVARTAETLRAAGADVTLAQTSGDAHELAARQRLLARDVLGGATRRDEALETYAFGNAHASEALPGALPRHQNSPRRAPYGLFPEQINGTGFGARRHDNLRSWLYRIRPSAQHTPFAPLAHETFVADWDDAPAEPNLVGHRPLPFPEAPTDFVDGIVTYGGAGHPSLRRGYAFHLYAANRSMEHRSFYDADGDLLIIPQHGSLTLLTELGALSVAPGSIAILPRGLKVSVLLEGPEARGYLGEVYGRHFELPERGPVGSNGLTDPRHFRAPRAFAEDRLDPGHRLTVKLGNALFEATQDHTPYDAVAWHGDYVPCVYDLADFSPVGSVRVDHPDPSIFTVLSAPLDEQGASSLDFVFFPPRWEVTEHTFRPPFFHRNATTEINGIISDPTQGPGDPFEPGCAFLTPSMTAHGVVARSVDRALRMSDEQADRAVRMADSAAWFQFESALPIRLTRWAQSGAQRVRDWPSIWGAHRARFDPRRA